MKTTLNIDDRLMRAAKKRAADEGATLTSVVERALERELDRPEKEGSFKLNWVTVRGDGPPLVDIDDRDALYDAMGSPR